MDRGAIDPQVYDLYDEYCHSMMERREFLRRASALVVVSGSGLLMARALLPDYARAQMISFTDKRIKARYVEYDSPGGNSGRMRGYLVQPSGPGPFPAVVVIHENRGLNPHIDDVARRAAVEGFLALAPDGLAPIGGYPGNDDDGKKMQRSLDGHDQAVHRSAQRRQVRQEPRVIEREAGGYRLLLWRRGGQLPCGPDGKRSERRRAVLWLRPERRGRHRQDQGSAPDPLRRERPAHQQAGSRLPPTRPTCILARGKRQPLSSSLPGTTR